MTTVIEHVRHQVEPGVTLVGGYPGPGRTVAMRSTRCGRPFLGIRESTRDTRHHEPARSRCPECWR